jgi:hypothetical protein
MASIDVDFGKTEREIFFAAGLDKDDPFEAACKMNFLAHLVLAAIAHGLAGSGRPIAHLREQMRS